MATDALLTLKNTVLEFITDLKDNILTREEEQADLTLVEFFFRRLNPDVVYSRLNHFVWPHRKKIKARDESFFIENIQGIFGGLPEDRVAYFTQVWTDSDRMDAENKQVVFRYFDSIVYQLRQMRPN